MGRAASKVVEAVAEKSVRRRVPKWASRTGEGGSTDEQYYMRSIGRALEVLNCFDGQAALSMKELGVRTALPESTLFRVLLTLERHDYLVQARDGSYQLAPKLVFGWLAQAANRVRETARPELERLANEFNETVSLGYLYDDRVHVLDCVETYHEIRMTNKIGRVLPPHCSALGKVITAYQDRGLASRMLEVYGLNARTDKTITDRQKLFLDFDQIQKTGVGCDREESILGGICFGAALRTTGRPVVAAISLSTPSVRMTKEREKAIQRALLASAAEIAGLLAGGTRADFSNKVQ